MGGRKFTNNQIVTYLLEIRAQHYKHAQHIQQITSAYLNLYLGITGVAFGALIAARESVPPLTLILVAFGIWSFSALFLTRSELLSSHVTHNLIKVRKVDAQLRNYHRVLDNVLMSEGTYASNYRVGTFDIFLEIRRNIFNTSRGIEGSVGMVGAFLSSLSVCLLILPMYGDISYLVVAAGVSLPILAWNRVNKILEIRHTGCCKNPDEPK